jgi:Protein of unknown function (DUF4013)
MTDQTIAGAAARQRYKLVPYGGGVEEHDRLAIRDRIRSGDVTGETELAVVGTDDWRPAASYAELRRYFELAAVSSSGRHEIVQPSPPRNVESMQSRVVAGILYPIAGGEAVMLLGLAILSALPFIGILGTLASTVLMVNIVRTSADGRTKMPLVDTSHSWELIRTYLRVLFITAVSLLPLIALVIGFGIMGGIAAGFAGLIIGLGIAALYYPACLATVAVWDSILEALNPAYVLKVIRTIGADYFIVVGMWFVATVLTAVVSSPYLSPLMAIPILGGIFSRALSLWVLFYVSHLLGYAVYRHAPELGWT